MTASQPSNLWLFTDLDGTLIPLDSDADNLPDLAELRKFLPLNNIALAYVTGRHLASALDAKAKFGLPEPSFIICDVGTTIATKSGESWHPLPTYQQHLAQLTHGWNAEKLIASLPDSSDVRLQEREKQGAFKISFYVREEKLDATVGMFRKSLDEIKAPYSIVSSIDPFKGQGLIDVLPAGVDKGYAAKFLAARLKIIYEETVVFAGDSGNDVAALTSGCRAIVVKNAKSAVAAQVHATLTDRNMVDRLFLANRSATSGVLEGLQHFLRVARV